LYKLTKKLMYATVKLETDAILFVLNIERKLVEL